MDEQIKKNDNECTKCGLTTAYSYSKLNDYKECKFCQNFQRKNFLGKEKLLADVDLQPGEKIGVTISGGKDSVYMLGVLSEILGAENIYALSYYRPGISNPIALDNVKRITDILGVKLYVYTDTVAYKRFRRNFELLLSNPKPEAVRVLLCAGCRYGITEQLYKEGIKHNIVKYFSGASYLELAPFKEELIENRSQCKDADEGLEKIIAEYPDLDYDDNLMIIRRDHHYKYKNNDTGRVQINTELAIKLFDFDDYFENNPEKIEDIVRHKYGWKNENRSWHFDCIIEDIKDVFYYALLGYTEMDFRVAAMVRYGLITKEQARKIITAQADKIAHSYPEMLECLKKHKLEHLIPQLKKLYQTSQYLNNKCSI